MLNENLTSDEQGELLLINITEELVIQTVKHIIPTMNMCRCEICKLNACAVALNALTPNYVITTKHKLMGQISTEMIAYQIQVLVETTKALMGVKKHPPH